MNDFKIGDLVIMRSKTPYPEMYGRVGIVLDPLSEGWRLISVQLSGEGGFLFYRSEPLVIKRDGFRPRLKYVILDQACILSETTLH